MENIIETLKQTLPLLGTEWLGKKNGYEKDLCNLLGWTCVDARHYDAITPDKVYVEIKKGQGGAIFDLVRYSELYRKQGQPDTILVFLDWKRSKKGNYVKEIIVVHSDSLCKWLLTPERADYYLQEKTRVQGMLNAQDKVRTKKLREIAFATIQVGKIEQLHFDIFSSIPDGSSSDDD